MPENVKWVKVLYLSLEVNRDAFAEACDPSALRMNFAERQALTQRLMDGFSALIAGDVNPLWKLYDEGINPRNSQLQPLRPLRNPRVHAGDCGSGVLLRGALR